MTVQTIKIHAGDRRTPLRAQLKQLNSSGVYAAVDLSGVSGVYVRIEDEEGNDVIALGTGTSNDCTIDDATNGKVSYAWSPDDVDAVGLFFVYFLVYSGDKHDTFPSEDKSFRVEVQ